MIRENSVSKDIATATAAPVAVRQSIVVHEAVAEVVEAPADVEDESVKDSAYYRGLAGAHKLLTATAQPTVASRVRQVETALEEVQAEVAKVEEHGLAVAEVQRLVEALQTTTKSQQTALGMLQQAQLQLQKTQLDQMDEVDAKLSSLAAAANIESAPAVDPEPEVPGVALEAFMPVQEAVARLARLDPLAADFAAHCKASDKAFQAAGAAHDRLTHALEREIERTTDDARKKAVEFKSGLDAVAESAQAMAQRLYRLVHFVGDALYVTLGTDLDANPTTTSHFHGEAAGAGVLAAKLRVDLSSVQHKLTVWRGAATSPLDDWLAKLDAAMRPIDEAKDKELDKHIAALLPALHALFTGLLETGKEPALTRFAQELLVEAQAFVAIAPLHLRFRTELATFAAHDKAEKDLRSNVAQHASALGALDQLQTVIKAIGIKLDYVVNNTQTMIVEEDLKSVVNQLNAERAQVREQLEAAIRESGELAAEREESLQHEVSTLVTRLGTKPDRHEMARAHQSMQEELGRLAQTAATVDDINHLATYVRQKPDVSQVQRFVNKRLAMLQLRDGENHDAPLLGSTPMRCLSCQNTINVTEAALEKPSRDAVQPFSASSVRHMQRQRLDLLRSVDKKPKKG
ncbi:hypothetical protein ACHHYP_04931 [Achlya hypogyna]|uniref:Uncharacterized protein n=1 Tax=Achlya hypogyna TaxID=1202772 RepID=A0A1V9Z068_ACHHY|nr:hypothetical protein ACHHYP_04931 [Achlya hypogyna]